ncbi:MAG: glycosyltransferase family 9 protein [Pirellulaceae bacterium]|nr:glycosyltransferase family 9 protein [Pirellulaceae bacterium]
MDHNTQFNPTGSRFRRQLSGGLRDAFQPERVMITRLSAIGDCLATLPLAVDVKRLWPGSHITWLVDCGAAALLQTHPDIDRVQRIGKKWMKQPKLWRELRDQLQAERFDLVLDPQGLTKSAMLGWLSGARVRVGFDRSHAREIAPWLYTTRVTRSHRHMVDCYRELLSPWHEPQRGTGDFHMPRYMAESQRVETQLAELQLGPQWICINVGAGWPTKLWPPSRFAEVGQALFRQRGLKSLVVWAGESEKHAAEQIVHGLGPAGILAPDTTLPELAEWLRLAKLVVSSDTGPAHLAAAVGTPSVVLFGPTWGDECGPYGAQHRVVQSIVIPPRGAPKRRGVATAMNAINVEEVVDACLDVLACQHTQRASA